MNETTLRITIECGTAIILLTMTLIIFIKIAIKDWKDTFGKGED